MSTSAAVRAGPFARVIALLSALVVGCTGQPATPVASPSPGGSPSATTPITSATPSPSASPSVAPTESPPSTDVVLRMAHRGGFLYPGMQFDVASGFTLYADGRVIYRPLSVALVGPAGRGGGLREATMTREQMDALVAFALGAGGLAEAAERYDDVSVADSLTTTFEINGGGVSKTVEVYALGDETEPGPETAHRERFKALADLLDSFEEQVDRGNATDVGPFQPEAYRVTIVADESGAFAPSGEWPWTDLEPADFEPDPGGFAVRTVSAEEAEPLFDLQPAEELGDPLVLGPDGTPYIVRYRPLLPDELTEP